MTALTNALNLPEPIVQAIANDPYNAGEADISVTRLIAPPRKVELERRHADEITEDAADRIWSLVGQIGHGIIERAASDGIQEHRLFMKRKGWIISGQFDRLKGGGLIDYKFTSVWTVKEGVKPEWEQQLNLLRLLSEDNGYPITGLQIVAIFRDWSAMKAKIGDHPPKQVAVLDVPVWSREYAKQFLDARIEAHQKARKELPLCTDEERWHRPDTWAVMKEGRKSALRVLPSELDAQEWCLSNDHAWISAATGAFELRTGYSIERRPGSDTRCELYCNASAFCEQFKGKGD